MSSLVSFNDENLWKQTHQYLIGSFQAGDTNDLSLQIQLRAALKGSSYVEIIVLYAFSNQIGKN